MANINTYPVDIALVGTEKLLMSNTPSGAVTNNTTVSAVSIYSFGVGAPQVTQAQRLAILSPVLGQMVYQTDLVEGTYQYKSTGWAAL